MIKISSKTNTSRSRSWNKIITCQNFDAKFKLSSPINMLNQIYWHYWIENLNNQKQKYSPEAWCLSGWRFLTENLVCFYSSIKTCYSNQWLNFELITNKTWFFQPKIIIRFSKGLEKLIYELIWLINWFSLINLFGSRLINSSIFGPSNVLKIAREVAWWNLSLILLAHAYMRMCWRGALSDHLLKCCVLWTIRMNDTSCDDWRKLWGFSFSMTSSFKRGQWTWLLNRNNNAVSVRRFWREPMLNLESVIL